MATLRDAFTVLHPELNSGAELSAMADGETFTFEAHCHYSFDTNARYVSYYLTKSPNWLAHFRVLISNADVAVRNADSNVEVGTGRDTVLEPRVRGNDLPFTGLVFLYAEERLTNEERVELFAAAKERGLRIELRDLRWLDHFTETTSPVAFVSHDSRDKETVVRPLVQALGKRMCFVWYDEYSLRIGDSLLESISRGISSCPKCLVIISPYFIANNGWSKTEFNAIMNRHIAEGAVILPVWHEVSRDEVAKYSVLVVDRFAGTTMNGIDALADELMKVLRPGGPRL